MAISNSSEFQPQYAEYYLEYLDSQCVRAMIALQMYSHFLERNRKIPNTCKHINPNSHENIADCIHRFANHTAMISKMLWPSDNIKKSRKIFVQSRSVFLKNLLGVDDTFLMRNRDMRNAIEHFDERLDDLMIAGKTDRFFVMNGLIDDEKIIEGWGDRAIILSVVNHRQNIYHLLGNKYDISVLSKELSLFHKKVEKITRVNSRLKYIPIKSHTD